MNETIQKHEDHWVITLVGRSGVEKALKPVAGVLKKQGLRVGGIKALSGTRELEDARQYACAEIHTHGPIGDEAGMRTAFLALSDKLAVDVAFQQESAYRQERQLFVFDMDSTLIQGEVIDELAKMAGVADRVVAITASAMRGEIEFQDRKSVV